MSTTARPITLAEFAAMRDPPGARLELHHGEVVAMTRPKHRHTRIQSRLLQLLGSTLHPLGVLSAEYPFSAGESDLRVADVAFVAAARATLVPPDEWLRGSPDLVIEVLSPSNTAVELYEKERLCLENGCVDFWVIDPIRRQVKVTGADFVTRHYTPGTEIPLRVAPGATIRVADIFESL